jgi:serine/threonine-protein kinase
VIEEEMLGLLQREPAWQAAVRRLLDGVAAPAEVPAAAPIVLRALEPALRPGDRVSVWTVVEHLSFGGEAELYRVRRDDERVAILKLWYDERVDPFSSRWREYRLGLMECGSRRGFPRVYEIDVHTRGRARAYAVLEWVEGPSWAALRDAAPAPGVALEMGVSLLGAVATAHEHIGPVGDLSPSNVIAHGDEAVIVDVCATHRAADGFEKPLGTPGYMAPEVASGAAPDARSDMFAAGVLCAEVVLGRTALTSSLDAYDAPLRRVLQELDERLGVDAAAPVARMLALDPAARPLAREAEAALRLAAASRQRV